MVNISYSVDGINKPSAKSSMASQKVGKLSLIEKLTTIAKDSSMVKGPAGAIQQKVTVSGR